MNTIKYQPIKKFALLAVLLLFIAAPASAETVCRVTDGATFSLCNNTQVHLACIGAPPAKSGKQPAKPMSFQATDALRNLILHQDVTLNCVGQLSGMQVCFAALGRRDVGLTMVKAGEAFPVTYYQYCGGSYGKRIQKVATKAKQQGLGIWSVGTSQ